MPAQILLFYHNVIHFVQQKQEVPEGATSIPTHPFHPIQESEESESPSLGESVVGDIFTYHHI